MLKTAEVKGILAPEFKDYMGKMNHNYEETKKDNDFIYHAKIPDSKSLPPIGTAALAKPIMPGEKLNANSQGKINFFILIFALLYCFKYRFLCRLLSLT